MTATIVGVDKASPVLDKVGGKATETGGKFSSAAKLAAGALAGISVVGFFKDSISAFADAQQSTLALQSAFERFPALGDTTAGAIEEISKALQNKTKFDDDANNAAAAQLAQFDLTGKQIEALLPLVDDYAAKTGKDLPTAASDLGKAFLGNNKSLKEIGINFHATGDRAKDFSSIMGLLQAKVGGFAEEQGKTASGQLAILHNQFDDLQKTVGGAVVPVLTELGQVAVPVATALAQSVGKAADVFGELPGPLKAGVIAFGSFVAISKLESFGKITASLRDLKTGLAESKAAALAAGQSYSTMGDLGGRAKDKVVGLGKSLAGPAGLALATVAVTQAISDFNDEMHLTDQIWSDNKGSIDSLANAYQQAGGAVTDFVRAQAFSDIQKNSPEIIEWAKQQGFSMSQLTDAYLNLPSGQAVRDKLSAWGDQKNTEGMSGFMRFVGGIAIGGQHAKDTADDMAKLGAKVQAFLGTADKAAQSNADLANATRQLNSAANGAAASVAGGAAAFRMAEEASESTNMGLGAMGKAMEIDGVNAHALKKSFDPLNPAIVAMHTQSEIAAIKAETFATKLGELSSSLYDDTGKARDLSSATNALRQAMDRAAGLTPTLTDATRDWKQALADAATKALDANKHTQMLGKTVLDAKGNFNLSTQAGRDLSITMEGMGANAAALAAAAGEAAGKTGGVKAASDAAAASLKQSKQDFLNNAKAMGLTADQAKALAAKYFAIPKNITTTVDVQYDRALADLNKLTGRTLVIPARVQLTGTGSKSGLTVNGALADGGPAQAGKSYLVGEQGPEIMTMMPDGSGFVTSSGPSKRVLAGQYSGGYIAPPSAYGSGATTVIVQVQGLAVGTSREVADHLARPVTEAIARQRRAGVMV
jgi:hypothetical protein